MFATALVWHTSPFGPAEGSTSRMSDADPGDHALVRDTLAGDDAAFAEIMRRHKGRVFGTCSRFARDAHQLDDLCQEVFLRAWRKLRSFRGDAPFEHWLARLTVTACYDFLRRERRHREQISLEDFQAEIRDAGADAADKSRGACELVAWAMLRLSPEERLVVTLLEIEERTVREIAQHTGWSESNVKVRAFRARARLKEILERSHEI
jgi:RNA polymerase sigma-70 factor, ECF subfamily